ncbi:MULTISPECIES: CocE/NonD family hydrolase [unclassified Paenibacillus]|uniref:CocE/NonD family hydrolase n=1 Tax=unclassified Paenibacillus TaxID=185978 RepID=UPI0024BBB4D3|nr:MULTISPECIES: CocE/NonD family hydrolase [unclassified Paenibacillus]
MFYKENSNVEIIYRQSKPVSQSEYPGFEPSASIIKKGTVHRTDGQPIPCDILCERDVAVKLRDGTTIYTDIFRPVDEKNVPTLVVWSPYGKRGSVLSLDLFPGRMDVAPEEEDGLNKFEGPNPGYWVNHGYAIVHPDPRGVFNSEGNIHAWGKQEAEDEYDVIEWVAEREWSNGKVGLTGNSWLAISQWNVASYRPPHLSAIAPWEGACDIFRETCFKGGVPDFSFTETIFSSFTGNTSYEDIPAMMRKYPLMNEYWEDKAPTLENIEVPAYIVASYTNLLHTYGTFEGWQRISSKEKWLRIHNTFEWPDYYNPQHVEDLRKFFGYYLKGEQNGWNNTPKVRLAVLNPGHQDILNRVEEDFPLERQQLMKLYLDASFGTLSQDTAGKKAQLKYTADEKGVSFKVSFEQDIEIVGYMKLHLWVSTEDSNDMDVFAFVRKLDASGKELPIKMVNDSYYAGASGRMRVSLRQLDATKSTLEKPVQSFKTQEKLKPGEIIPVEIGFWPMGMKWHAGEQLELLITGVELLKRPEFPEMSSGPYINQGTHTIYTGEEYDSYLIIPVIPSV